MDKGANPNVVNNVRRFNIFYFLPAFDGFESSDEHPCRVRVRVRVAVTMTVMVTLHDYYL